MPSEPLPPAEALRRPARPRWFCLRSRRFRRTGFLGAGARDRGVTRNIGRAARGFRSNVAREAARLKTYFEAENGSRSDCMRRKNAYYRKSMKDRYRLDGLGDAELLRGLSALLRQGGHAGISGDRSLMRQSRSSDTRTSLALTRPRSGSLARASRATLLSGARRDATTAPDGFASVLLWTARTASAALFARAAACRAWGVRAHAPT
jgi:hypothetical protein